MSSMFAPRYRSPPDQDIVECDETLTVKWNAGKSRATVHQFMKELGYAVIHGMNATLALQVAYSNMEQRNPHLKHFSFSDEVETAIMEAAHAFQRSHFRLK